MEYERTGILTSIATTKRGTFISFICGAIKRNSYLIKVDDSLMNEIHALVGDRVSQLSIRRIMTTKRHY